MYFHVTRALRLFAAMNATVNNNQEDRLARMASHLKWYPLIFILSWIPNTIIRVIQASKDNFNENYDLALAHA
jgi:phage-related protein